MVQVFSPHVQDAEFHYRLSTVHNLSWIYGLKKNQFLLDLQYHVLIQHFFLHLLTAVLFLKYLQK